MYAVVWNYSGPGAAEVLDLLGQRGEDVTTPIGGVPGFASFTAIRNGDGGLTVTVCEDKAGTDESSRRAARFVVAYLRSSITTNVPETKPGKRGPAVQLLRSRKAAKAGCLTVI